MRQLTECVRQRTLCCKNTSHSSNNQLMSDEKRSRVRQTQGSDSHLIACFSACFPCMGIIWYFLRAGRRVRHSAGCGGPFQGGRRDSFGEEVQQRALRRCD